jgi:hypothetical protein
MRFLRFVILKTHPVSGVDDGIFGVAHDLVGSAATDPADRQVLDETLKWFDEHLRSPARFNRTRSKGYYRRANRAISWLRETAVQHIAQMHRLKGVLDRHGYPVAIIREQRVGYVVYEDEYQVVAEPFEDTRTRGG